MVRRSGVRSVWCEKKIKARSTAKRAPSKKMKVGTVQVPKTHSEPNPNTAFQDIFLGSEIKRFEEDWKKGSNIRKDKRAETIRREYPLA